MMVEELAQEIAQGALDAQYVWMAKEQGWDPRFYGLLEGDLELLAGIQESAWQEECQAMAVTEAWVPFISMVVARVRGLLADAVAQEVANG
jgi:hypothetical protein